MGIILHYDPCKQISATDLQLSVMNPQPKKKKILFNVL